MWPWISLSATLWVVIAFHSHVTKLNFTSLQPRMLKWPVNDKPLRPLQCDGAFIRLLSPLRGGMGPGARHLLYEVSKKAMSDTPVQSKEFRKLELYQLLSMALARQVASQLSLRCRILEDQTDF